MKKFNHIIFTIILIFALPCFAATEFTGKIISIADGDTVTVLNGKEQIRVRLYGIDCPEKHQDFGNKAKQYVSELIFGKHIKVVQEDIDKYGRTVGIIYFNDRCINEEILKNGFAWVYQQYCNLPLCKTWLEYETNARINKMGLWSQDNPTPPWDFRHSKKSKVTIFEKNNKVKEVISVELHGNNRSHIFHKVSCRYYDCKNCTKLFNSKDEAINAGYRPCKICNP